MSYIELPIAEYRRRLAALPAAPAADDAHAAAARLESAVKDLEVRAARSRYPEAFVALDVETGLNAAEVAERERLIVAAIDAIHGGRA